MNWHMPIIKDGASFAKWDWHEEKKAYQRDTTKIQDQSTWGDRCAKYRGAHRRSNEV